MTVSFLEESLMADMTIKTATYSVYSPESLQLDLEFMILDSQAIEHLEVL